MSEAVELVGAVGALGCSGRLLGDPWAIPATTPGVSHRSLQPSSSAGFTPSFGVRISINPKIGVPRQRGPVPDPWPPQFPVYSELTHCNH